MSAGVGGWVERRGEEGGEERRGDGGEINGRGKKKNVEIYVGGKGEKGKREEEGRREETHSLS